MAEASTINRTPLEDEHRALGARLGPFARWLMPIEYAGTLTEHRAVREAVGLFDLTHLGKVTVEGPDAFETLQRTLTNDLSRVAVGGAAYGMVLNDRGGIVDDLITYRTAEDRFLVVPNAANVAKIQAAIEGQAGAAVEVRPRPDICILAPQGPRALDLVTTLFPQAAALEYMRCAQMRYGGVDMVVSRSGYTGERGFELFVPAELAVELWRELMSAGEIQPCGLAARDTLRLEMGYPLHGSDISEDTTPLEAALSWAVALDKGEFPGREALLRQKEEGIPSRLWGLRMEGRLIPRAHYPVFAGEERVGETTSGTFSPTLRIGVAMAYLSPRERFSPGDTVEVDVRGRRGQAEVVKPPFVGSSPK